MCMQRSMLVVLLPLMVHAMEYDSTDDMMPFPSTSWTEKISDAAQRTQKALFGGCVQGTSSAFEFLKSLVYNRTTRQRKSLYLRDKRK
jgi:hypothetical protein